MTTSKRKQSAQDKQVKTIVQKAREALGKDITLLADSLGINLEHVVRFSPLAKVCKTLREQKGISIKDVAGRLNAPQYAIKNIEEVKLPDVSVSVLRKYIDFLGMTEVFAKWEKENPAVLKSFKP
jgi:ribosome-binding protein aMBF1 (putative translation factor)